MANYKPVASAGLSLSFDSGRTQLATATVGIQPASTEMDLVSIWVDDSATGNFHFHMDDGTNESLPSADISTGNTENYSHSEVSTNVIFMEVTNIGSTDYFFKSIGTFS